MLLNKKKNVCKFSLLKFFFILQLSTYNHFNTYTFEIIIIIIPKRTILIMGQLSKSEMGYQKSLKISSYKK